MDELDQYKEQISNNLNNLEDLINRSALFHNDETKWKTQISRLMRQTKKQIMLLQEGVRDLPDSQIYNYVGSIKSFKKKLQKLERDIEKRQRGQSYIQERSNIIKTAQEKRENARQEQLFKRGDEGQDTTMEAVNDMLKIAEQGKQMADSVNVELVAQIEQLDRMRDKVQGTQSTLSKAQKNITYFAKALECDKCMVGLLALIFLALVSIIVLAIKKSNE